MVDKVKKPRARRVVLQVETAKTVVRASLVGFGVSPELPTEAEARRWAEGVLGRPPEPFELSIVDGDNHAQMEARRAAAAGRDASMRDNGHD